MIIFLGIFWIVCGILSYGLILSEEFSGKYFNKGKFWFILIGYFGPIGLILTIIDIKTIRS